jgi:bifunctional UDP-N-acetylglucosamine pyrophosphorylase / glucosamine-1-phosphate N-acetyltransferase
MVPGRRIDEKGFGFMNSLAVIILAAGKGTRMKSAKVKVLHTVAGLPMLSYSLDLARKFCPEKLVAVVGFQGDAVRQRFDNADLTFVRQEEQLGTGHAVRMAAQALQGFQGTVLILCGDVPLLTEDTVRRFLHAHRQGKATLSVLTTFLKDPKNYGRIFRREDDRVLKIVEDKDLKTGEEGIREINTGIYCVNSSFLFSALPSLSNQNAQREYYLTDIVALASARGEKTIGYAAEDPSEVMGINTRADLAQAARHLRQKINEQHMLAGVSLIDPLTTYIDSQVEIGRDTVVFPNCHLVGQTSIGEGCVIEPGCKLADTRIGNGVTVKAYSVISESVVADQVEIGPFAHLRPQTTLLEASKVGNFVELKKSVLGKGSKANHLSYIGDSTIGEKVNVGAGTITCNYDGKKKHPTVIEDEAFIGSNTALVAPIRIGRKALIGAGSTITREVPPETLAVTRAKQVHYKKRPARKE